LHTVRIDVNFGVSKTIELRQLNFNFYIFDELMFVTLFFKLIDLLIKWFFRHAILEFDLMKQWNYGIEKLIDVWQCQIRLLIF
jgi:hypothetical protein